jgi:hypothetical protein
MKYFVLAVVCVGLVIVGVTTVNLALAVQKEQNTDWRCMQLCQQQGMLWSYCKSVCSY